MRPLVQEPRKTASTLMSSTFVFGSSPMYSKARSKLLRSASLVALSSEGTLLSMVVTMPGDVPQVTLGARVVASMVSSRSKVAPSSVTSADQFWTARFQAASSMLALCEPTLADDEAVGEDGSPGLLVPGEKRRPLR